MTIRPFTVTDLASTLALDREAFAEQGYTSIVLRQAHDVFDELFRVYEDGDGGGFSRWPWRRSIAGRASARH
jgi:hypothetical protein